MTTSSIIRCNGCGARVKLSESYAVHEERACSAECIRRILLRDVDQATSRIFGRYEPDRRLEQATTDSPGRDTSG
jgi:hypothetical protein